MARFSLWKRTTLAAFAALVMVIAPRSATPVRSSLTPQESRSGRAEITIRYTPGSPSHRFSPSYAFGAGVDGHELGDIAPIYRAQNIRAMLSAGLKPLTYRLRTELGIDDWHWNPRGRWSERKRHRGYWVSDDRPRSPIRVCYGYRLPRRGNTVDQAGNTGYSRLDDGNPRTFWKSSPYLDRHFTGEDNDRHPQWVVVDFGRHEDVNAARITWGIPFAVQYRLEYWQGSDATGLNRTGRWLTFPLGVATRGRGGSPILALCRTPVSARYVRLIMTAASGTAPSGSDDIRDRLGYAINEIRVGVVDRNGRFIDKIRHSPDRLKQTVLAVSSTDPWHSSADFDKSIEQPGFDLVYRSGLTNRMPVLVPVGVLYSTPENAAAEIRYLTRRHYPIAGVELGEEPDGQFISAEDYAALYLQFSRAIHSVDPAIRLGGPSFQDPETDVAGWPEEPRSNTWLGRVLHYLQARGHRRDFDFCSLEWYPFDDICGPSPPQLQELPDLTREMIQRLRSSGLGTQTPLIITEYGYSAFAGRPEVDLPGALLNAEIAAQFMELGGSTAYLYGYEPTTLQKNETCGSWGNNLILLADSEGHIRYRAATYYGARMLSRDWVSPGSRAHEIYPVFVVTSTPDEEDRLSAYVLLRPDHLWSLLLINKDPAGSLDVRLKLSDRNALLTAAAADVVQLSPARYVWRAHGEHGHPDPDRPPARWHAPGPDPSIHLPPYSLTVVRTHFRG